jgi:hypothetical protein
MTTMTMTTKGRERMIRQLAREWRDAVREEEDATDLADAWRLAARSDAARRRYDAAMSGQDIPVPRTKKNLAKGAFIALAAIGRTFARIASAKAGLAKAHAANLVRKAARQASVLARASLRRVIVTVVAIALFLATHETSATTKEITMSKKNTKNTNAKKNTKKNIERLGKLLTTPVLNAKERTLLKEMTKHRGDVMQSLLFVAFERRSAVQADDHERAGWDVRNSVRKLLREGFAIRTGRGVLQITKAGRVFASKGAR